MKGRKTKKSLQEIETSVLDASAVSPSGCRKTKKSLQEIETR